MVAPALSQSQRITFRGNLRDTRHGWLRLTPAYSFHLVREQLQHRARPDLPVLEPFCGTGTTLLACAELGIDCTAVELNPFLVWLARAKTAGYSAAAVSEANNAIESMARASRSTGRAWVPEIHQIDKWWDRSTLGALARARAELESLELSARARDLATLAFCRSSIGVAKVSFGHQSMSFRKNAPKHGKRAVAEHLLGSMASIGAAASPLPRSRRKVVRGDARNLEKLPRQAFGTVITSPPYANRMSYIRELRPYMYWLGYLQNKKSAGELDWKAIGGTWGIATSNVARWEPDEPMDFGYPKLQTILRSIAKQSDVLSRYVEKYFYDMHQHASTLRPAIARGGKIVYVIGNSKFYDVLLPAQDILAAVFESVGFRDTEVTTLRKRTSKRELFEYLVTARKA